MTRPTPPALPAWTTAPDDVAAAVSTVKAAIRSRLDANGSNAHDLLAQIDLHIDADVADIVATRNRGDEVWPVTDFDAIGNGTVTPDQLAYVKRRGCLVIRGHFDHDQARRWDDEIVHYVESNNFFENYRGPGDDFFSSVQSKPEIYPIYWSHPQMQARQHPRMVAAQRFLNSLWHDGMGTGTGTNRRWFDPNRYLCYPDRIRRRPEGTTSGGLGAHIDTGTIDLWMSQGFQQHFAPLWNGDPSSFDPWLAAERTTAVQYPSSTMCSAFRTFQGWTALSDMDRDQGVLHTVPIPMAIARLVVRPLADDVDDGDLCGVKLGRAFPVQERWHDTLLQASSPIPDVRAGDSVWWHCDMVHSVAPVVNQRGWGNVMYIPAAPWCERNERYASSVREALHTGGSPADFPEEHYETSWTSRFTTADLNADGRASVGLPVAG